MKQLHIGLKAIKNRLEFFQYVGSPSYSSTGIAFHSVGSENKYIYYLYVLLCIKNQQQNHLSVTCCLWKGSPLQKQHKWLSLIQSSNVQNTSCLRVISYFAAISSSCDSLVYAV